MIRTTLLTFAALAVLPSATVSAHEINHQASLGRAIRNGCHVQQVHTPAGKLVHASPIVTCPATRGAQATATERAGDGPPAMRQPAAAG